MTVFQVPASKASFEQNQFKFDFPVTDAKGKVKMRSFSMPLQQFIHSSIRVRVQQSGQALRDSLDSETGDPSPEAVAEASRIQYELFERYAPGLYEIATDDQIRAIQEAWQEESTVSVGESSPSAD